MKKHIEEVIEKFGRITDAIESGVVTEDLKPYIPDFSSLRNMYKKLNITTAKEKKSFVIGKIYGHSIDSFVSAYFPNFPKHRVISDINALSEFSQNTVVIDEEKNFDLDFYTLCILPLLKVFSYKEDKKGIITPHNRFGRILIISYYQEILEPTISLLYALSKMFNIPVSKRGEYILEFNNNADIRFKSFNNSFCGYHPNFMILYYRCQHELSKLEYKDKIESQHIGTILRKIVQEPSGIFQLDNLDGIINPINRFYCYNT